MSDEKLATIIVAPSDEVQKTRVCKTCGKILPLAAFHRSGKTKDGYAYSCKCCSKIGKGEKEISTNPRFEGITARELIDELRARGYRGKLTLTITKEVVM